MDSQQVIIPIYRPIHSLALGLDSLRDWFEREAGHVRVMAIQSAT